MFLTVFTTNMYAQGRKALGICDRCGFTFKLKELRYETENKVRNGLRVCPECFDPDHPQFDVNRVSTIDPQALYDARVDTGEEASARLFAFDPVGGGITALGSRTVGLDMRGELGEITLSGVTSASPTPSPTPAPTPAPTPSPSNIATPTATTGTTSLGSVTVSTPAASYTTYTITVANYYGSNYFYVNGSRAVTLNLVEGQSYRFDQSDSSNSGHPLRFSTTSDGTHGGGSEYTTGVTTNGTPGSSGAYTQIDIASGAPTLYYYCTNHSGMGGQINT